MPYADRLLADGERIIRRERQHWVFPFLIAGKWVAIAVIVGITGFVISYFVLRSDGTSVIDSAIGLVDTIVGWVTFAAILIAIVGFVWSVVQWQTQEYVLTDVREMRVSGVINKQSSDSSLENITDAQISIPWLGRMLGFGDLVIMTASEAGIENLRALRDPIGFKKALMEAKTERLVMINTPRTGTTPPIRAQAAAPAPPAAPAQASEPAPAAPAAAPGQTADDVTKTLASLAQLRDSGAITPEEYDAKKSELLDRI
ncbi:MAG: SHOCT domain-containing protein [Chloroflexi bacterium]|nr:SHOCT domain-containing protein [Chloroflexota bacterium]